MQGGEIKSVKLTKHIIGFTLWYLGNLCVDFVDACDVDIQACKDDF